MVKRDLTNQRFGRLVVQYELPERKNGKIYWHCHCDCGNEKDIAGVQLTKTSHPTQSCGCLQRERTRLANQSADLTGQHFGRLTVLQRLPNSSQWECQCECGNKITTTTNHLNSGHTQSCGCLQKDRTSEASFINLTGKTFGYWFVQGLDVERSTPKIKYYNCICRCGTQKSVNGKILARGDSQSCGCLNISHGELKIRNLLTEYNIPFEVEKTFDDCINPKTGKKLRFDFFVNNKYLIEFNGKQHYEEAPNWREPLADLQYRDSVKQKWANTHNIPLIIIPYTRLNTMTVNDLLINQTTEEVKSE